jgi:hypothetical protein
LEGAKPFSRFHWIREVRFANSYQRPLRILLAIGHDHARCPLSIIGGTDHP